MPAPSTVTATGVLNADLRGVHYDFLKDRVPAWFNQASQRRQEELASHELFQIPSWYRAASPDARAALAGSHTAYREALNTLEGRLGGISSILDFAEQPLKDAIKKTFNLDLDVRRVYFARKYGFPRGRADLYGALALEQQNDPTLSYRYRGVSLLEAALANFEPDEEQPPTCNDCQVITTFDAYDGEIIPTFYAINEQAVAIAPHAFARLCRTLDLGALYQRHLKDVLEPQVVVERAALVKQFQEHQRRHLAVSVETARLQFTRRGHRVESGISDDAYRMLKRVLADEPNVTLDGRPVTFAALKAFGIQLVGPLLIGPDRGSSTRVERLVVYIPNDPQQPLKEYASSADFMADLRTRLHSVSYRRFFSRFIPQREQGSFFKQFNTLYQPVGSDDAAADYPLKPSPGALRLDEAVISGHLTVVRKLYPSYGVQKAREFIWNLGAGADAELARLEQEFDLLQSQLDAWVFSGGGAHQRYVRPGEWHIDATPLSARNIARARILKCWRRETPQKLANDGTPIGLELDLSYLNLPSLPDLDVDFSHVGSLKLNNMGLSTSPENFLARFSHVRWLDLSNNVLRELPPALGAMPGLTRLFLQRNRIRLTSQTARILSERVSLRALFLESNDLRISPDFSEMTDLRSLNLAQAGLDTWPTGLGEQPLLDLINLSGNGMTTIPESVISPPDERLAQTARVNDVTNASDNPWSDATLQQVRSYGERLQRAGLALRDDSNTLVATVPLFRRVAASAASDVPFRRWVAGLTEEQVAARQSQWNELHGKPGADGFFAVLRDLEMAGAGHADLQRRVWEVIDTLTANSAESESLREQMFEWAGRPACCDRAALSFSNLEIMALVYKARLQAMDSTQGAALSVLSRGLFRLDQVEKIALNDIDLRRTSINDNRDLTPAQKDRQLALLEEVEIRLAYRYGLKDRLALPGQPTHVRFTSLGKVTPAMLDAAHEKVVALDQSPEEFQALLSRAFWQDYITNKYRPQFEAQSKPFQEEMADLYERHADGRLSPHGYERQAKDLQARMAIEDAALIDRLTRQEIAERLVSRASLQTLTEPVAGSAAALQLSQAQAIEFDGKQYFIASMPDAGDGQHYLLRVQSPNNPYELSSSGIIARPDVAGVWRRRGQVGGMQEGASDDEFEPASESMPVAPYTAEERSFMRQDVHYATIRNQLGAYNRANNAKYPFRDLQGRPVRIRSLERQVKLESGTTYTSAPIKPYIEFEGYERVGALYEEKLQWRRFTADDVKVPGESALIGQSMVVANRRIAKGEIVGVYGGVIIPGSMSVNAQSTFGMVAGFVPQTGISILEPKPIFVIGDTIISRINTNFEYDPEGKPVRQAPGGYNVEAAGFNVEAEHATSRPGVRTAYILNAVFATEDIPAGVELRIDYGYTEGMIKTKFS